MTAKPFDLCVRLILFDQHGYVLVLKRSPESKIDPSRWELPGGKIKTDETFDTALKREIQKETGFTVAIHTAAGTAMQETDEFRVINLVMIGTILSGGLSIGKDHCEYRWAGLPEISVLDKADWFTEYFGMYMNAPAPQKE